ncbi:hypothetical protein DFP73DRAFT_471406 [Morchella snyderi]|nr:hypothetical protein DFP73DRAFT_471406 [Morchella snyderi]
MSTHESGSNILSTSGLAARRQQHPLPQFHLSTTRPPFSSFTSALTPPPVGPNEMTSPMSSGASSVGTVSTMASFSPVGSVGGYWTSPSNTASYGYNSAPANPSYSSNAPNSSFGGMRGFSGNGGPLSINRGNSRPSSPATGELVPQSTHYEGATSSFSGGMPMTTGAGVHPISASAGSGLPSIGQGPGVHNYPAGYASAGSTSHPPINSQSQPQDPYSPQSSLPPPTPSQSYYSQQHSPSYTTSPPIQMSGPPSAGRPFQTPHYPPLIPLQPNFKSSYPPLPGMGAQVMGPGGMLAGHPHTMMSHHHHQQQQQAERPYKCDQCPQSFNRNHDLKRHKRIHLAVKPFPCSNCEKSFSRKDALKRHRLVKGCGKADAQNNTNTRDQDSKQSPSSSPSSSRVLSSNHVQQSNHSTASIKLER